MALSDGETSIHCLTLRIRGGINDYGKARQSLVRSTTSLAKGDTGTYIGSHPDP